MSGDDRSRRHASGGSTPRATLVFDRGTLLLSGPAQTARPPEPEGLRWQWDGRVSAWRCDALHYRAFLEHVGDAGRQLDDGLRRGPAAAIAWPRRDLPVLRAEQEQALKAWREAGGRGVLVMPTGTGKTEVGLAAMAELSMPTLVVAPIRDLMYQWHRRIAQRLGYDAGILGDSTFNVRPVTVTTYDSAFIHMPDLGDRFGLVIFDEVHHLPGRCRRDAALMATAPHRMGLSATPERADDRHLDLDTLVGPVVYRLGIPDVARDTLADYVVRRIPVALDDEERRRYGQAGDVVRSFITAKRREHAGYSWKDLCADVGDDPEARRAQKAFYLRKSIEDRAAEKLRVLEDLFRLHAGERTIVFAGSNAMALDVSSRFLVPTLLSHSRKRERQAVLDGFAAGRFPVIVANQVLDEGVDVPEAKVAVVIGGMASTRQAKQRLGRVLRRSGDRAAVLYEVVCEDTGEVERSRQRRRSDAYPRPRHHRL